MCHHKSGFTIKSTIDLPAPYLHLASCYRWQSQFLRNTKFTGPEISVIRLIHRADKCTPCPGLPRPSTHTIILSCVEMRLSRSGGPVPQGGPALSSRGHTARGSSVKVRQGGACSLFSRARPLVSERTPPASQLPRFSRCPAQTSVLPGLRDR